MLGSVAGMLVQACNAEVDPADVGAVRVLQSAAVALSKYMIVSTASYVAS